MTYCESRQEGNTITKGLTKRDSAFAQKETVVHHVMHDLVATVIDILLHRRDQSTQQIMIIIHTMLCNHTDNTC